MVKLSELPPVDTQVTPQEKDVMKKYFGEAPSSGPAEDAKPSWMKTFKVALYATILFLALCNPITDSIFCHLPWCGDGVVTLLAAKTFLFMMIFVGMYKFVI